MSDCLLFYRADSYWIYIRRETELQGIVPEAVFSSVDKSGDNTLAF